jgi:hypothetical protein
VGTAGGGVELITVNVKVDEADLVLGRVPVIIMV